MRDLSHLCNLHHSSWQSLILNPLSEVRDRTCVLIDFSQIHFISTEPQWELPQGYIFKRPSTISISLLVKATVRQQRQKNESNPLICTLMNMINQPIMMGKCWELLDGKIPTQDFFYSSEFYLYCTIMQYNFYFIFSYNDFYFFNYTWFTVFCQFSTV